MLIQVVHSHPLTDSYNHASASGQSSPRIRCRQVIRSSATDLYRESLDPVMTEAGTPEATISNPMQTAGGGSSGSAICGGLTALFSAFRTGGSRCRLCLKGYFDRVVGRREWRSNTTSQADGSSRLLTNMKLFGVVTTYGSPWWLTTLFAGDPGRKVLMRALEADVRAAGVRSFYLAHYDMDRSTDDRKAFMATRLIVSKV